MAVYVKYVATDRFQLGADGIEGCAGPGELIDKGDELFVPTGTVITNTHLSGPTALTADEQGLADTGIFRRHGNEAGKHGMAPVRETNW